MAKKDGGAAANKEDAFSTSHRSLSSRYIRMQLAKSDVVLQDKLWTNALKNEERNTKRWEKNWSFLIDENEDVDKQHTNLKAGAAPLKPSSHSSSQLSQQTIQLQNHLQPRFHRKKMSSQFLPQ